MNTRPSRDGKPLTCVTAGSVDDGKSTLIGRLLFDSDSLFKDQLEHVANVSRKRGLGETDLSLLTDGLRAEREQGITIDVAWRYFRTPRRRFVLADSPGHVQYTRNMVTAASHGDVTVIVVDAKRGPSEQTRRHLFVAKLLGVPSIVVAVNKMDQVGYRIEAFARIRDEIALYLESINLPRRAPAVNYIPISALRGDNVVSNSPQLAWFDGPPLLRYLETLPVRQDQEASIGRLAVQLVLRTDDESGPIRGYAGRVTGGALRTGDAVRVMSSGWRSTIARIDTLRGPREHARPHESVVLRLADDIDIGRGDTIILDSPELQTPTSSLAADVAWMHASALSIGAPYILKHGASEVRAVVEEVDWLYDVGSGQRSAVGDGRVQLNELARVRLRTSLPVPVTSYGESREAGSFLLIDPVTAVTLAAGMVA